MMEDDMEPRLFLGCKKEGCNGVLCVSKAARHGMPFQCPRCLNKQKYCADCKQLYINFRRHRQLGHELYEFQRKRQVLMRNNHGLFIPGKYVLDHDQSKKTMYNPSATRMPGGHVLQHHELHDEYHHHYHHEQQSFPQHRHQYLQQQQQQPLHHLQQQQQQLRNDSSETDLVHATTNAPGVVRETMDVGELEDASDILVKLLHSANKGGQSGSNPGSQQPPQQQPQQQQAPSLPSMGKGGQQDGMSMASNGYSPPRPAPSGAGPASSSSSSSSSDPLPIATTQQAALGSHWASPFISMSSKMSDQQQQLLHQQQQQQQQQQQLFANWGAPAGPTMPPRVPHHHQHPHHQHPYHPSAVQQPRAHVAQISISQV